MSNSKIKDAADQAYDDYRSASDSKQKYLLAVLALALGIVIGVLI